MNRGQLAQTVQQAIADQPVTDLHTHCYAPAFGDSSDGTGRGLLLWGIDELVTYHYLVAEVFRVVPAGGSRGLPYEKFWRMTKQQQADHIWRHLFVENTPLSEACRGVLTTLTKLGLDPNEKTLAPYRKWFARQNAGDYVDKVMRIANVDSITMTNPVFDDDERSLWEKLPGVGDDPRFEAVLRIDPLLRDQAAAFKTMNQLGYEVGADFSQRTIDQTKRFLTDWLDRMKAVYVAMSLPPEFRYPAPGSEGQSANTFIDKCLMPVLADRGLPWAMMIGSRRQVNPALRDAGDMLGKADIRAVVNLCAAFPDNRFMVTMLSRENQHELCVAARKFGNLLVFGCWWFLNNPSIVKEITQERLELLGPTFAAQHSDARILDQLIYKWDHARRIIADVLTDKYADLLDAGFNLTEQHVRRDARLLLRDNYRNFCKAGYG